MVPLSCLKNPRPTRIFLALTPIITAIPAPLAPISIAVSTSVPIASIAIAISIAVFPAAVSRAAAAPASASRHWKHVRVTWVTPPCGRAREREALPLSQPYPLFRSQPHGVRGGERVLLVYGCSGHGDNRCPPPVVPLLCHVFMSCLVFAFLFAFLF